MIDQAALDKVKNMLNRDVAQLGSALRLGRRGRRFESCHPDHFNNKQLNFFIETV